MGYFGLKGEMAAHYIGIYMREKDTTLGPAILHEEEEFFSGAEYQVWDPEGK